MGYIIELARNARLHAAVEMAEAALADAYQASGTKQRLIGEFAYAAKLAARATRDHAAGVRLGTQTRASSSPTCRASPRRCDGL